MYTCIHLWHLLALVLYYKVIKDIIFFNILVLEISQFVVERVERTCEEAGYY